MAASLTISRSVTEIQNLLVCDACKQTIKEPKILPCSHSFCKACLDKLTTEENVDGEGKTFACPTCMSTVTLKANENVAGLPENEFIVKLLTALGPDRKKEDCVCSHPCCKKEPSITICMECEMLFCHACYIIHEGFTPMQRHTMFSISEIINRDEQQGIGAETLSCTQHKDAIPKFYCETCEQLICMKCVASVHTKPGHTCVAIYEIFRKQQEAVKSKHATINAMKLEGNKVGAIYTCFIYFNFLLFVKYYFNTSICNLVPILSELTAPSLALWCSTTLPLARALNGVMKITSFHARFLGTNWNGCLLYRNNSNFGTRDTHSS